MQIEQVNPKGLKPAEYNPRQMTEKQAKDLTQSIKEFGLVDPIIVNNFKGRENVVIGGHQRLKIALQEDFKTVPVVYVSLPIEKERELNLRLNKNNGEWDWDLLANFDEDMLKDVGFESEELDKMFNLEPDEKDDEVPEVPKEPKAKLGDIYQLGKHRVMCGDSTKKEDVERLMSGKRADMVFTDPPYNVDYSGRGKETSNKILNDKMERTAFLQFLKDCLERYKESTKISAPFYICHASSSQREFEDAMNFVGLKAKGQIIWNKTVASMGWGDYRWKHEPIFYATFDGKKTNFYGDRSQYTVWNESWDYNKWKRELPRIAEKQERGRSTVWTLKREVGYKHPTQKPIQLIEIALKNSSKRDDVVLDVFLGSGSTLIACEKTNRICYGMELDPKYCDVIIKRWEDYTGNKAIKI